MDLTNILNNNILTYKIINNGYYKNVYSIGGIQIDETEYILNLKLYPNNIFTYESIDRKSNNKSIDIKRRYDKAGKEIYDVNTYTEENKIPLYCRVKIIDNNSKYFEKYGEICEYNKKNYKYLVNILNIFILRMLI